MKIKVGTLRRLIREGIISEISLSPAAFNEKPVKDPMQRQNVSKAMGDLERFYSSALMNNLVLAHKDKYNAESRDFDDATYEALKSQADRITEKVMSQISNTLQQGWLAANKENPS